MKLRHFLEGFITEETDAIKLEIYTIIDNLEQEELDEFCDVLYNEFFEKDPDENQDDYFYYTIEDAKKMVSELGSEFYDYILDLLSFEEEDHEVGYKGTDRMLDNGDVTDLSDIEEGMSRRMKVSNMNKKKRKFMANSVADLRRTKAKRRIENRKSAPKRRQQYRANKIKVKAYQKSRWAAINKSGKHHVKLRRKS